MRRSLWLALMAVGLGVLVSTPSALHAQKITRFDVPGATYTMPTAINPAGKIVGYYIDARYGRHHGFLRHTDGDFVSLDAPGAGPQGTTATAINPEGEIVGFYVDANSGMHGFLRNRKGTFTSFDPPGGGAVVSMGTDPTAINPKGEIAGYFNQATGFLRTANGALKTFTVLSQRTIVMGMNPAGQIVGYYISTSGLHGFLLRTDGTYTSFDAFNGAGTGAVAINPTGQIAGFYLDANSGVHGFLRDKGDHKQYEVLH